MSDPQTSADDELARIRGPFIIGAVVVVLLFAGLLVGLNLVNGNRHRPEGTAERWLAAVGDTTRKGVQKDALKRARKDGDPALAKSIIPADTDKKSAFPDLEVGKATVAGATAHVPYLLHQRAKTGKNPKVQGDVVLQRVGDSWKVTSLTTGQSTGHVPSDGGSPPSRAPAILWLIAVVVGVLVTAGASALVVWAGAGRRVAPAS